MGRRLVIGFLSGLVGYLLGAIGGGLLVALLSSNTHDRSVEAAMTGAFVLGPLAAIVGFVIGFLRTKGAGPTGRVA
jgi:uncharacterized membrane protein YfcA